MKSLILFISLFLCGISFGQKKLIARTAVSPGNSSTFFIDSFAYHYGSWVGSINEFTYKEGFDFNGYYGYQISSLNIAADSIVRFSGDNNSFFDSSYIDYNSLSGDVIQSTNSVNPAGSLVTNYTYHANGKVQSELKLQYNSGLLFSTDSIWNNYDGYGNKINTTLYYYDTVPIVQKTDTFDYQASTNKLIRFVRYYPSSSTSFYTKNTEIFTTYIGNKPQYSDIWSLNTISGNFEWSGRLTFSYLLSKLSKTEFRQVQSGVLSPTPDGHIDYDVNSANQLINFNFFMGPNLFDSTTMLYDSDNYLITQNNYSVDTLGSVYNYQKNNYYYQSTLSIPELNEISVSIFPNPSSDYVQIQTSENIKSVEVYNTSGQLLIRQNMAQVDVRNLPSGAYVVRGQTDNGSFSKKFVKE
jgi:hypothetical protein